MMASLTQLEDSVTDNDYDWPFPPNSVTEFDLAGILGQESAEGMTVNSSGIEVLNNSFTKVFLPTIYIIIIIVGVPTNAMAIWVFLFKTKNKHPTSILMANLALADLLFIIWLPLKIFYHFNGNNWIFGEPLCKVLVGFFYGNMYCSTIFIACISVQRCWTIVRPFSEQKSNNCAAVCVCMCVWIAVCLITTPFYLYDQTVKITNLNITTCQDVIRTSQSQIHNGYFLTMSIVGYVVPSMVCIVAYVKVFHFLNNFMAASTTSKNMRKAIILMITVLIMFLLCFTPSNIILMVHYSLLNAEIENDAVYGIYIIALCLSSLNSCIDPFVYYFISDDFREYVKNILMRHSECTTRRKKGSFNVLTSSTETTSPANTMDTPVGEEHV